jgi:putative transcriptional regulator
LNFTQIYIHERQIQLNISIFAVLNSKEERKMGTNKDINRIKVVLAEKKRTSKWLAEQLHKDPATVSKWCTNTTQPGLETLREVAKILDLDIRELLRPTKE